jgi:hypothetical protein
MHRSGASRWGNTNPTGNFDHDTGVYASDYRLKFSE